MTRETRNRLIVDIVLGMMALVGGIYCGLTC